MVLFYEVVSQMRPQEETEERVRKTVFIIFTVPRDRRHKTPCRATQKMPGWSGGRRGSAQAMVFIEVFVEKARQGRSWLA